MILFYHRPKVIKTKWQALIRYYNFAIYLVTLLFFSAKD